MVTPTRAASGGTRLARAWTLRRRSTSRLDRYRMGKQLRRQVPRSSLGDWSVQADRPDPVQLIIESHRGRLDWLLPMRVGRMTVTPYGFLRGAATVMAEDVARLPSTGITPVICGDSHLRNFGFYASPEQGGAGVKPDEASPRRCRAARFRSAGDAQQDSGVIQGTRALRR